jgi:hypothetical protein
MSTMRAHAVAATAIARIRDGPPKSAVPPRTAVVQTLAILLPVLGAWTDQVVSGRYRLRNDRASSSTSRKRSNPPLLGDQIKHVAMPGRGGVGAFAGGTLPLSGPVRQAATGHVGDIADQPVAPLATTVGDVVATQCFDIARETVRQFGGFGTEAVSASQPVGGSKEIGHIFRMGRISPSKSLPMRGRCALE